MEASLTNTYKPFKARHALQLAAPHTWAASVLPALIGVVLAEAYQSNISIPMALVLLAICVLMQSSVNSFNDYFDFVKGTDTEADALEEDDSTLVNDHVNPRWALALAIAFLAIAFALGVWVIVQCGLIPLWIALIGAVAVILYSAGSSPISSLPLGELVSGFVMGALIPLACFFCLTGLLDLVVLALVIPEVLGVGLIMMTNNTCDIEKDASSSRRTLPVLLGRSRTKRLYQCLTVCWFLAVCIICILCFQDGLVALPFMLFACMPLARPLWKNPLVQRTRIAAMGSITTLNVAMGAFYALCMLM